MVHFLNPNRPADERISVWCERYDGKFLLVRQEPGGDLHEERFTDRTALFDATVRWQAALTNSGWQPAEMIRTLPARRRTTRAGQFHR